MRRLSLGFIAIVILWGAAALPRPTSAQEPGGLYTIRERFGVGLATSHPQYPDFPGSLSNYAGVETLGFGWYADWSARIEPERPGDIEYAQMLSLEAWRAGVPSASYLDHLRAVAAANPGALWIVGNEPDHMGQGNCTPDEYAGIYHRAYTFLKKTDPTAQVAIGGIVMPSPLRLMWLEQVLDAYRAAYGHLPGHEPMPVDVWNTHVQILRENWWDTRYNYAGNCAISGTWGAQCPPGLDPHDGNVRSAALQLSSCDNTNAALFRQQIIDLRQWLVDHGQGDKPLIISEYGVLMPDILLANGAHDVQAFMRDTFDFLLDATDPQLGYSADGGRLVQRWLWFSLNSPLPTWVADQEYWIGFNGSLYDFEEPSTLTLFGEFFRDYVAAASPNLSHRLHLPMLRND